LRIRNLPSRPVTAFPYPVLKTPSTITMLLLGVLAFGHLAAALVTLQTIREITNCTKDCTAEIIGLGLAQLGKGVGIGQVPVLELRNDDDEDEMEDVSAF
jgi:hypothetical protein